ncbi:MAG: DUF2339 domain-containing protein [Verrucomicrobia bacterium]|nr:DUF2339 domain-containing protein [Verrucomicrobiota bacterium]
MDFLLLLLLLLGGIATLLTLFQRSQRDREAVRNLEDRVHLLTEQLNRLRQDVPHRIPDPLPPSEPAVRTPAAPRAPEGSRPSPSGQAPLPSALLVARSRAPEVPPRESPPLIPGPMDACPDTAPPPSPPLPPVTDPATPSPSAPPAPAFNWEQFVGVRLFAWLGGLALFFAAALGLKYSFEHNLVPPEVRAAAGFFLGTGLLIGGVVLRRREYTVTAQTLCATGVVILYAVTFACRAFYHFPFFGPVPTFLLMTLITATAFALAVRLNAPVVAVLGMLGGFLTPLLLSTGQDNALGLFGYIALLDLGLIAVVQRRRWHLLVLLAMVGTVAMQLGWHAKFFSPEKIFVAQRIFLGMPLLFLGAAIWALRGNWWHRWIAISALAPPLVALGICFPLLFTGPLGYQPGRLFSLAFGADLMLLLLVVLQPRWRALESAAGSLLFALLSLWTSTRLTQDQFPWAFGLYLAFALLHTVFPWVLQHLRPGATQTAPAWSQFFPALALILVLLPILRDLTVPGLFWLAVLAVDVLAVVGAIVTGAIAGLAAVLCLTLVVAAYWIGGAHQGVALSEGLLVIAAGALFFFGAGLLLWRRSSRSTPFGHDQPGSPPSGPDPHVSRLMIPCLSASLPFLLLMMVAARFRPADPSSVFALGALLLALLLGLVRMARLEWLLAVGFGCTVLLQWSWQSVSLDPTQAVVPLLWELGFYAVFLVFPFFWAAEYRDHRLPWVVSALSGPVQFGLIHLLVSKAFPNPYPGLLPAAFAVPSLLALMHRVRHLPEGAPHRLDQLAWAGGVVLFFITIIFPIQWDRQWITLAWALEGAALCWLFLRVPHAGLPAVGFALLLVAFIRLALNPAVLTYHPRSSTPILNWYLYTYGLTTLCLFAAARFLGARGHQLMGQAVAPVLQGLGTVLAFLLVNMEIADYFGSGHVLTFEFSGNFARDMTYTIAWALFAFLLLVVGIRRRLALVRYAGLALLGLTLLKLFLHDLSRLNQLYRVGAFAAVAVIAMVASFLYQRFLAAGPDSTRPPSPHEPS